MNKEPDLIDHEIRLRQIESQLDDFRSGHKSHHDSLKGQFTLIIGTVVTSVSGLVLHAIKLI